VIAVLRRGWETIRDLSEAPVHPQACLAKVVHSEELRDGRRLLMLRGTQRVLISRETRVGNVRMAEWTSLPDVAPRASASDRHHRQAELFALAGRLATASAHEVLAQLCRRELPLGPFCDVLSHALPLDGDDAVALLGEANVDRRSDMLLELLRRLVRIQSGTPYAFPPRFGLN
jgi:Lon protease-like protein